MNKQILVLCVFSLLCFCKNTSSEAPDDRPNIVLIMADDLGYSDLGCFGSEIHTPNIDALAAQGQIFTNFYTSATCSPTRSMLLSGTDNHIAGLGNMAEAAQSIPEQRGKPGYEGYLNGRVVSFAELLRDSGYRTYMAGKWHLGLQPEHSPKARGFQNSFALLNAAANHFVPDQRYDYFWEDDDYTGYPAGEFSTDYYTDKALRFLKRERKEGQPFFLYAAYTAPHWPLQAPQEYIDKYQGRYDMGYGNLRSSRLKGLHDKGIISPEIGLSELPDLKGELYRVSDKPLEAWENLDELQKREEARSMEIYAAMVDNLDVNIGRLIDYLKEIGQYDNTLIVFCSDNGAAVLELNQTPPGTNRLDYMGTYNSFLAYGPQWAHASSAPFQLYKGYIAEGGIRSPMIIKAPYQQVSSGIQPAFSTIMDLAPTFLDLANVSYPSNYQGREIHPLQGESILPLLNEEIEYVHASDYVMGWELFGRCAVRKGNWKITKIESPFGKSTFELFDLENDPTENIDLAQSNPEKYQELLDHWNDYVKQNGLILLE